MRLTSLLAVLLLAACAAPLPKPEVLKQEVADTERAFAKTMADRDHAAFASFLDDETVFFGSKGAQRGKAVVAEVWKQFYSEPQAPFSWEPTVVEVLDSGTLALSHGPVFDPSGKPFATFTSIWRRNAAGQWKIIFDRGCSCPPPEKK